MQWLKEESLKILPVFNFSSDVYKAGDHVPVTQPICISVSLSGKLR